MAGYTYGESHSQHPRQYALSSRIARNRPSWSYATTDCTSPSDFFSETSIDDHRIDTLAFIERRNLDRADGRENTRARPLLCQRSAKTGQGPGRRSRPMRQADTDKASNRLTHVGVLSAKRTAYKGAHR